MYYTRLQLILNELYRLNLAQVAAHSALHCVISTVGADKESGEDNYKRLQKNRNLFKKMLHFQVSEDDERTIQQRLIEEWKRLFGSKENPDKDKDTEQ